MPALQGAAESGAPVSRLHEQQSFELSDFPVPTGRQPPYESARAGDAERSPRQQTRTRVTDEPVTRVIVRLTSLKFTRH
jgi:hypothetical protein